MVVLTNVPEEDASAAQIARLYRGRWGIERAFQEVAEHLEAEVQTLGYPKVALFGFAVGLVTYNMLSVLKAALRAAHGPRAAREVSGYYLAVELSRTYEGLMIALPLERWVLLAQRSAADLADLLRGVAGRASLRHYRRHRRGPKKPVPRRRKDKYKPHVSTAKLLVQRKQDN